MIDVKETREALEIAIRRMDAQTSLPLRALAAALKDGVIVPREPTALMLERGWNDSLRVYAGAQAARACWESMLAAAPTAEHKEGE